MMNMLIKLDEKRVLSDAKYDLEGMWQRIDRHFATAFTKNVQSDGSVLYKGIPEKNYFSGITRAVWYLEEQEWFAEYCIKWIWYDNDDNEELPFQDIDVLARRRREEPLFAKYAKYAKE